MICNACGQSNPAGARFCNECATPLAAACGACGGENPPGAKFCNQCAAPLGAGSAAASPAAPQRSPLDYTPKHLADKILQSKSALEGERKQVTVMFADVKGSMELAEQLDPEEFSQIMQRFFSILSDGVERFEGFVDKFTGDGIMALFGAPIAHEDHAQRACYAALHLLEALRGYAREVKRLHGLEFAVRIGLNSGEVVVGRIGDDLRMEYTAQGHAVGLAQRMEALAEPNSCALSATTAGLVSGYFELENLGAFSVKGVTQPLTVHALRGVGEARTRLDRARKRGLSKLVGRDREIASLESALEEAIAGNAQVVGVVAEAGTGKSRLCAEFVERCRARGLRVHSAHCPAHGKTIPYLPLLEILRDIFDIDATDSDHEVRRKVAGELLLLDDEFQGLLPLVFDFLGVSDPERPVPAMSPDAREQRLFAFIGQLSRTLGAHQPIVLLLDDLHWIDAGSDAFLARALDAAAGTHTLWLVNFRPEYHADWTTKSTYRQLPLQPLGREATAELLASALGVDPSLAALTDLVHERSAGNPFFTEEIIQTLIESRSLEGSPGAYRLVANVDHLEVPSTVHAVLAARIDRLGGREKQALQAAAVIGKEIPEPILAAVLDWPTADLRGALQSLHDGEFVYEESLFPVRKYAFKHPLTQEVALNSQLRQQRSRTHAAVAGAIEQLHADEIAEHSPLLAHHWEEAGQALPAAHWHRRASQWIGRNDFVQGLRHTQRVLELTRALEPSDERDSLHLYACRNLLVLGGWSAGLSRDVMDEILAEGVALATRTGDVSATVDLHTGYGIALGFAGDIRAYLEGARKAAALIDDSVSRDSASNVISASGYSSLCLGRHADALEFGEQARKLAEGDPSVGLDNTGFSAWGWSAWIRAQTYTRIGRLDEARALFLEALHITRTHDMREPLAWTLWLSSELADALGAAGPSRTADEARRHAFECLEIAEQHGSNLLRIMARRGLGLAHVLHEEWTEATEALEWSLATARARRNNLECEAAMLADLSRAHLGRGETQRARTTAEEAITRAQKQGALYFECMGQLALARALRADPGTGAPEEIAACLNRALALVHETGGHTLEPQILEERASLAALRGDHGKAAEDLRRAHARYVEIGASEHAERLAAGDLSL